MKRLAVSLVVSFLLVASGSQAAVGDRVHAGVLAGVGGSLFKFTPDPDFKISKPLRPTGGGLVALDLGPTTSLEARVLWQRKVARWTESPEGTPTEVVACLDYLSVPLLIRVAARPGRIRPYLVGGAEVMVRTGARLNAVVRPGTADETTVEDETFSSHIEAYDLAVDAGAGVEIPVERFSVFVEGLYSHGLQNLAKPDLDAEIDSIHARTFRVSAGIRR